MFIFTSLLVGGSLNGSLFIKQKHKSMHGWDEEIQKMDDTGKCNKWNCY